MSRDCDSHRPLCLLTESLKSGDSLKSRGKSAHTICDCCNLGIINPWTDQLSWVTIYRDLFGVDRSEARTSWALVCKIGEMVQMDKWINEQMGGSQNSCGDTSRGISSQSRLPAGSGSCPALEVTISGRWPVLGVTGSGCCPALGVTEVVAGQCWELQEVVAVQYWE